MLNLKLQAIASLISKEDIVIDTCTDHAYLAIYLKKNQLCKEVYASDISKNALDNAINNIKDNNLEIKTYLSDGFKNIDNKDINTAIIAGVGTTTVINIVNNAPLNITKYLISSNNNHAYLRKYMLKQGFYIQKEVVIAENNKYYPIMLLTTKKTKENKHTLKYGKSNNKEYFQYLIKKEKEILNKIPNKYIFKRFIIKTDIKYLTKLLKK